MKIVIICAEAPPEPGVSGRVHWDMALFLAAENNEVWLISPFPSRPLGTKYAISNRNKVTQIEKDFYHVNINSFIYPKYNLFCRTFESMDFGIKAIRYVNRKIKEYDLIYVSCWPFIGQFMVLIIKKNKKAPLVMNVQDLYPESFFAKIKSKTLVKILKPLYSVDKFIAKRSSHITVISESLKQAHLKIRKTPENKISVLHLWQDETEFVKPVIPKEQILGKYNLMGINGKFIYMYLGNIGSVAGVETIINAFAELNIDNSALIVAGSGSHKEKCRLLAERLKISNIFFMEVPPGLKPVAELQSISDILMLPILPEAANSSIPSKLIAYMFSGKPVITSANSFSETASAIKESGCGWITKSNDNSEWTLMMTLAYETDNEKLNIMGRLGFDYAIRNYSKKQGLIKVNELFHKINNK
jgi:glycosyltransferase involved in cell wall biosynthesis